jgi:hypothetical protein
MPFDLQSDIPDRALPDALRTVLSQQTKALEALLQYANDTKETIRANGHLSLQEKTMQVDALAKEVSQWLIALEDQHRQMWAQLETFQQLLRRQGNSILAHTVERAKAVLQTNMAKARKQIRAMVSRME